MNTVDKVRSNSTNNYLLPVVKIDLSPDFVKQLLEQHLSQDHGERFPEMAKQFDILLRDVAKSAGLWTYVSIVLYLRKRPAKVFKFEGENAFAELENELEAMFKKLTEWSNQVDAEVADQNKATSSS